MTAVYDEVEIEDFEYDGEQRSFFYPCPCGDRFQITCEELSDGEELARCPSCSLMVRVVYDEMALLRMTKPGAFLPLATEA